MAETRQADRAPGYTASRDSEFTATALPLLPLVKRVALALARDESDADDVVQETFLRAYRHWHTFEKGSDCRKWLNAICRNVWYDLRRKQRTNVAVEDDELESLAAVDVHGAAVSAGLGDMYSRIDLGPAIMRAIGMLDPVFREVVVLSDLEEFSYEEIAVALDIPIGTVRSRLYRGRRHLQEALMVYALDAGYGNRDAGGRK
jgi:RNA polymerase sigma-70 factor (ECF subfamily)